jgi:integrase
MIHPGYVHTDHQRLTTDAGVPPLTPHPAARHTWATLALSSGVHPGVVQERLGHSQHDRPIANSHVTEGMDREAAERVAAPMRTEQPSG